jgi:hypothetical protein
MESLGEASDLNHDSDSRQRGNCRMLEKAGIRPLVAGILDSRLRGNDTISGCDSV